MNLISPVAMGPVMNRRQLEDALLLREEMTPEQAKEILNSLEDPSPEEVEAAWQKIHGMVADAHDTLTALGGVSDMVERHELHTRGFSSRRVAENDVDARG